MENVFAAWRWQYLWEARMLFLKGLLVTIEVALGGLVLALILGFLIGTLSTSRSKGVRVIARIYLEIFRNIPLPLQMMFMFYALIYGGINVDPRVVGIVCLGLCIGALISEIVRGGLSAIPKGQYEAAESQGLSRLQTMRIVVYPQMLKVILPPLATQLSVLILNTCAMSMIAGGDLMYVTSNWANNGTLSYGPAYLVAGILFFIICFPITRIASSQEKKRKYR